MFFYIFFNFFFLVIIISGYFVFFANNPVQNILFLILIFLCVSFFFISFRLDFLAFFLIIIYVGAVSVLFLFIIMMLNIRFIELIDNIWNYMPLSILILFIFCCEIFFLILINFNINYNFILINWLNLVFFYNNIIIVGELFYSFYIFYLIFLIILLIGILFGCLMLVLDQKIEKNIIQDSFKQVNKPSDLLLFWRKI